MGKYALDAFERYPLVKLRPAMQQPAGQCCHLLTCRMGAEPAPLAMGEGPVILVLAPEEKAGISQCCQWIEEIGRIYSRGKNLAGIVLAPGPDTDEALLWACCRNFHQTVLLAEPGGKLIGMCRRAGIPFGLWLPLSRGILPLRRAIAENGLARCWEHHPVYFYAGKPLSAEELDAVRRWHVSGGDVSAVFGAQMTLRRLMFPRDLTAGGLMPLRMWWQNLGTAPLYQEAQVCLELRSDGRRYPLSIEAVMQPPKLGDSTFNTTARLPDVPAGTYSLWCGLRSGGKQLPLAMEGAGSGGMYQIGEVTLDQIPRPYLATMWEEQYADGYYPLEDPAQPE